MRTLEFASAHLIHAALNLRSRSGIVRIGNIVRESIDIAADSFSSSLYSSQLAKHYF
jgi:hypothetical protein